MPSHGTAAHQRTASAHRKHHLCACVCCWPRSIPGAIRHNQCTVSAPPIFFNEIFLCVKHYHQDDLMLLMCSYSVFDAVLSVKRGTGTFFENEGNEDFLRGNCPQSFFFLPSLYQSLVARGCPKKVSAPFPARPRRKRVKRLGHLLTPLLLSQMHYFTFHGSNIWIKNEQQSKKISHAKAYPPHIWLIFQKGGDTFFWAPF